MCQQHPYMHPQPPWSMEDEDEVVDKNELEAGDRAVTEQEDAAVEYLHHHHQLGESYHPRQQEQHQQQATNQTKSSGTTTGTIVTVVDGTSPTGTPATRAHPIIKKIGHQVGCTRDLYDAYVAAGHKPSKVGKHKTSLPTNPQANQA